MTLLPSDFVPTDEVGEILAELDRGLGGWIDDATLANKMETAGLVDLFIDRYTLTINGRIALDRYAERVLNSLDRNRGAS